MRIEKKIWDIYAPIYEKTMRLDQKYYQYMYERIPTQIKAYPYGNYPIFEGYNLMQYQIQDPKGFALMLENIIEKNEIPHLPFMK